ncbi:Arc family DNA-binding protein [Duganella violaceipulchra]|uniref:Arc family DNA-binding protein n=1 Tax=Duganella violaceipulchra TaxID=2849652 RepID=A0AA41HC67_9BURK|nr:Arc family DNA-binding protein [Duganella violaceicalia]MBV6321949.1 Arc family DNA-binding protein [Duganella violaceicalia]MCP2007056.1 hypothetical protein [Duganella violaceicalia]
MNKSPIKKPTQDDYIKTSLRIPRELHAKLMEIAEYNGRTLNAEIIDRLQAGPIYDLLRVLARDSAETKALVKEMHDLASK